jgi:hypothetical protein
MKVEKSLSTLFMLEVPIANFGKFRITFLIIVFQKKNILSNQFFYTSPLPKPIMLIIVIFKLNFQKLDFFIYNDGSQKKIANFKKPTFFTTQFFPENPLFLLCF